MISSCFTGCDEVKLPEDILVDLETAYSNPERLMICLDLSDLYRFMRSGSDANVIRSTDVFNGIHCLEILE